MPQNAPQIQFPRWYPTRGNYGSNDGANAISALGDDLAGALMSYKQKQDQKKQDDLANALMNNGQSPGAAPYVRRATYEDGDQGDDPGPVPFDSTDTPYTGGQSMAAQLAESAKVQQKAQQQALAAALATKGRPMSEYERYGVDNPDFIPPAGRKTFAPTRTPGAGRGKPSNLLPIGVDPLPGDPSDPQAATDVPGNAPGSAPSTAFGQPTGILGTIMGLLSGGGSTGPSGPPDATPSATPMVAQGGVAQVTDAKSYAALPSGSTYRDPNGKVRKKP